MNSTKWWIGFALFAVAGFFVAPTSAADGPLLPIGVAKVDVTPTHPVRLAGYAGRIEETEEIGMPLYARAIALGGDEDDGPAILVGVDNCGVPDEMVEPIAAWLEETKGIARSRLVITSTHTHSAPWLEGFLPYQSAEPLPPDHQAHKLAYTEFLEGKIKDVILSALDSRRPRRLSWSQGSVGFAGNRRAMKDGAWAGFGDNPKGPVDHDMPLLCVREPGGEIAAVVLNYACHCTTLTGQHNTVHGDWAGVAQQQLEEAFPGAVAMVTIGCGADNNPNPRSTLEYAEEHGEEAAQEARRLLDTPMTSLAGPIAAACTTVSLPFDTLPDRATLEAAVAKGDRLSRGPAAMLAILDRGEPLPTELPYTITTWKFGDDLTMIFLPGEVVVDYSLRLKRELAPANVWVTAYANDVPCYIASKRVIGEGGYEVDSSMAYYGQPTRFRPEIEEIIVDATKSLAK